MDNWLLLHLEGFIPMGVEFLLQKPFKYCVGKALHAKNPQQNWYHCSSVSGRSHLSD